MTSGLKIQHLNEIETQSKPNGDFTGVRKWLLLYRPKGIEGWIAHLLFYFCALAALVLKVRGIIAVVGAVHGASAWLPPIYFTSASLFVWLAFRLHHVSERFSRSSNPGRR